MPVSGTSWALRYRADGASRKLTLGSFPALGIAQARRRAEEARGAIARGEDPASEKKAARAAAKAEREEKGDLIERVVETFIERHAKRATRDWKETERLLKRNVIERWKGRRLSTITKWQVHDLLDSIIDRGAPIAANRVFAQLRLMCSWAVTRGIIERSPWGGVSPPSSEKGRARERVLDDDDLHLIWRASKALSWPFGPVIQLLILTGARRDEVGQMEWREVDLEARVWRLPAARAKNARQNDIPAIRLAVDILKSLPRFGDRFVFTTTGDRVPVSGFNKAKLQFDGTIEELRRAEAGGKEPEPIKPWVFHDLRRTAATNLQRLGVWLEVTEAILNHVSGSRAGIVGVYQKHDYAAEKREALDAWATRLNAIVGENAQ